MTARAVTTLLSHPEYLTRTANPGIQPILPGYAPTRFLDDEVITTFDTPPNRFFKHFLTVLNNKLRHLARVFAGTEAGHLVDDCRRWWRTLEIYARANFLEEVGPMHLYPATSQVLLKQDGYRQLNDYYRHFLLTGRVAWDGLVDLIRTPNKDLATLYEYWCYFELLQTVSNLTQQSFSQQDILRFSEAPPYDFRISLSQEGQNRAEINDMSIYYCPLRHGVDARYWAPSWASSAYLEALQAGFKPERYVPPRLTVPVNVYFSGTVNVDETTYMFSPKVLDRANTIEFNQVSLTDYFNESTTSTEAGLATAAIRQDFTHNGAFIHLPKTVIGHSLLAGCLFFGTIRFRKFSYTPVISYHQQIRHLV